METTVETAPETSQPGVEVTPNYVSSVLMNPEAPSSIGAEERQSVTERTTERPQQETRTEQTEETTTADEPALEGDEAQIRDTLLEQFAKETGLDPNNPSQRKTLDRFVDKELHIRKLEAENRGFREGQDEEITDWEQQLFQGEQPQPTQTETQTAVDRTAPMSTELPKFGDAGDNWKSPADAYTDLNKAWQEDNLQKVGEIENAIFARQMLGLGAPMIIKLAHNVVQDFFQRNLANILPEVHGNLAMQREIQTREFAIEKIRQTEVGRDIDTLLKPVSEKRLKYDGEEFEDTPFNRIALANQEILAIRVTHNPATGKPLNERDAQIATKMLQYRAALKIHRMQADKGIDPAQAGKLVDAGRRVAARTAADRTRHGINAGPGATTAPDTTRRSGSYVEGMLESGPGESLPFASLFK